MGKSTKKPCRQKPYPDFPLFPHASGRWCKKVRGKQVYFGSIQQDPTGQAALAKWLAEKDYLLNGLTPPSDPDGLTMRELVNRFLTDKAALIRSGALSERTFRQYDLTCGRLIEVFTPQRMVAELTPADFGALRAKLAVGRGPVALGNEITVARMLFKYAYDQGFLDGPLRYGQSFDKPSRKTLRIERAKRGSKMFEAEEIRAIIEATGVPMKAFVMLGINAAFGATDISTLPKSAIDLVGGWVVFPRGKTGICRRCPLWPETVAAVQAAIESRSAPKDQADDELAFLTRFGTRWVKLNRQADRDGATPDDALGKQFKKLLISLELNREGRGFYSLRHSFRTIADDAKDQPAAGHIMGHHDSSMSAVYRERISDERLIAVTETVRRWLFPPGEPSQ
jgi:integrase